MMMDNFYANLAPGLFQALASSAVTLGLGLFWVDSSWAASFEYTNTFLNPDPDIGLLGESVAISGNLAIAGAAGDESDRGVAYLFDTTTGDQLHTFVNPFASDGDAFGHAVAISGNNILVGSPFGDEGDDKSGAAYLFDTTGNLLQSFAPPPGSVGSEFGSTVALFGNTILIGSPYSDEGAGNSGTAYLFDALSGNLLHTLVNPTAAGGDLFGSAVSISGNNALIGAFLDDEGAENSGAAYLFDTITGNLVQTFLNPTVANNDLFGSAVAIDGNNVLISARADDEGAANSGVAYLFDAATGNLLQTLVNPTPANGDVFGVSLALSGNNVLIGSSADDEGGDNSGAVHLFDATTGDWVQTIVNPTPGEGDLFGNAVAIDGNLAIVGAFGDDDGGANTGAAHLFQAKASATVPESSVVLGLVAISFGFVKRVNRNRSQE
jgi:FG-GAP repeat